MADDDTARAFQSAIERVGGVAESLLSKHETVGPIHHRQSLAEAARRVSKQFSTLADVYEGFRGPDNGP